MKDYMNKLYWGGEPMAGVIDSRRAYEAYIGKRIFLLLHAKKTWPYEEYKKLRLWVLEFMGNPLHINHDHLMEF